MAGIDFLRAIRDGRLPPPPIGALLGFSLAEVEPGHAVFEVTAGRAHYNPIGVVHGGLAMTLLDSAMGCAVQTQMPAGGGYATLEAKTNLVRAITAETGPLRAIGKVVHARQPRRHRGGAAGRRARQALRARHQYLHRLVETADGRRIAARFFHPEGESKGAVLIVPAMGCGQDYYKSFASWLAAQGFTVATFDYRGTGLSRCGALRGFKADIFDWARLDRAAMISALPQRPLYWIGHSLGGQILPLVPNHALIKKAVTDATAAGYWRENSPRIRPMAWRHGSC